MAHGHLRPGPARLDAASRQGAPAAARRLHHPARHAIAAGRARGRPGAAHGPKSEAALAPLAAEGGFRGLRGSGGGRARPVLHGGRAYGTDRVIRATGDNPLTSARLARAILAEHERRAPTSATTSASRGARESKWSSRGRSFRSRARLRRCRTRGSTSRPSCTGTRTGSGSWRRRRLSSAAFPEGRVTVDTPDDLREVTRLFEDLYTGRSDRDRARSWPG